jgi:hypothetical protein
VVEILHPVVQLLVVTLTSLVLTVKAVTTTQHSQLEAVVAAHLVVLVVAVETGMLGITLLQTLALVVVAVQLLLALVALVAQLVAIWKKPLPLPPQHTHTRSELVGLAYQMLVTVVPA